MDEHTFQHRPMATTNRAAALKDPPSSPLYFFDQVSLTVIRSSGSRFKPPASFLFAALQTGPSSKDAEHFVFHRDKWVPVGRQQVSRVLRVLPEV